MRLARIQHGDGVWLGRLSGPHHAGTPDTAHLLHRETDHPGADALREAIHGGLDLTAAGQVVPLAEATLLAPVGRPGKVIAIGLNYRAHARESGLEPPTAPICLAKWPNSIIGPDQDITVPTGATSQLDYEVELAVVIGRTARQVPPGRALDHVLGVTVSNDVSARDAQFADGQWTRAKSFDSFCPLGPWLTTLDEIGDLGRLRLTCTVNGECRQDSNTADMIFPVPELVAYLSSFATLEPGDVILTGTPQGVGLGRTPPTYLADGDTVTVAVDGAGALTNRVVVGPEPATDWRLDR